MALSWLDIVLLGFAALLLLRFLAIRYLRRLAQKQKFYQEYIDILTLPQYKVKGNSDQ